MKIGDVAQEPRACPDQEQGEPLSATCDAKALREPPIEKASSARDVSLNCTEGQRPPRPHRELVLMASVQLSTLLDQQMLPVNLSAAGESFGFSGIERDEMLGGNVAIAFFTAGAVASILVGWMADFLPRKQLIGVLGFIGALGSGATGRVGNYSALLACRALVGVAVGGVAPAIYSALGDLCSPESRPKAVALLAVVSGAGPGIGQVIAGVLGPAYGWRIPFDIAGVVGIVCAAVVLRLLREPVRRTPVSSESRILKMLSPKSVRKRKAERANASEKEVLRSAEIARSTVRQQSALRDLFRRPTFALILLQGAFGCVPWAVVNTFLPDYLAQEGGLDVSGATLVYFSFGAGMLPGNMLGGFLGQYFYRTDKRMQPAFMAATTWAGMLPMLLMCLLPQLGGKVWQYHVLAFFAGVFAPATAVNARAILLNTSAAHIHGVVFGVYTIMDDLGRGAGPFFISLMERTALRRAGALMTGLVFWLPCGICCGLVALTVVADEAQLQGSDEPEAQPKDKDLEEKLEFALELPAKAIKTNVIGATATTLARAEEVSAGRAASL
eukprot:TRINITY_DN7835_c0_g1_i1.p1 TRINITY_DN7835_c0_g1~~TRINITY_DN7835_c0_g1_i1.p1  ORF type:complete len:557 (+),score=105.05 TRINITY_DN7835_c0_g1_i1:131-1801(+)